MLSPAFMLSRTIVARGATRLSAHCASPALRSLTWRSQPSFCSLGSPLHFGSTKRIVLALSSVRIVSSDWRAGRGSAITSTLPGESFSSELYRLLTTGTPSRVSTSAMPAWPIAERENVLAPVLSGPVTSPAPIR